VLPAKVVRRQRCIAGPLIFTSDISAISALKEQRNDCFKWISVLLKFVRELPEPPVIRKCVRPAELAPQVKDVGQQREKTLGFVLDTVYLSRNEARPACPTAIPRLAPIAGSNLGADDK
jgi:hypothetical protein